MTRWLFWVAYEWALILTALACAWFGPWWIVPACMLVLGTRFQALIVLGHEVAHHTLGRGVGERWANPLCFWVFWSDLYAYREAHIAHHRYILLPEDPEVIVRAKTPDSWTDLTPVKKVRLILGDLVGLGLQEAFYITQPVIGRYTVWRVLFLTTVIGAVIAAGLWPLLLLWVWTLGTVTAALARARTWGEHLGLEPGQTHRRDAAWWQRALYLPHYVWMHEQHHRRGCWHIQCWDLRHLP